MTLTCVALSLNDRQTANVPQPQRPVGVHRMRARAPVSNEAKSYPCHARPGAGAPATMPPRAKRPPPAAHPRLPAWPPGARPRCHLWWQRIDSVTDSVLSSPSSDRFFHPARRAGLSKLSRAGHYRQRLRLRASFRPKYCKSTKGALSFLLDAGSAYRPVLWGILAIRQRDFLARQPRPHDSPSQRRSRLGWLHFLRRKMCSSQHEPVLCCLEARRGQRSR